MNNVDINRNYGAHWQYTLTTKRYMKELANPELKQMLDKQDRSISGDGPFSESETQSVQEAITSFSPDIMISVHSGSFEIFSPHVYKFRTQMSEEEQEKEDEDERLQKMLNVVSQVAKRTCRCGSGRGAEVLH